MKVAEPWMASVGAAVVATTTVAAFSESIDKSSEEEADNGDGDSGKSSDTGIDLMTVTSTRPLAASSSTGGSSSAGGSATAMLGRSCVDLRRVARRARRRKGKERRKKERGWRRAGEVVGRLAHVSRF